MGAKKKTVQYEVTLRCTVKKSVTCEGCTKEQARANPFDFAVGEQEIDQEDYEVLDVQEAA